MRQKVRQLQTPRISGGWVYNPRSAAPPLVLLGPQWIEGAPTSYLDLVISITVAMLTGHCVVGRHPERKRLTFSDFCTGCRSAEEEETVIYFLYQCPSLERCRYELFGSPSIDVKEIASFIKLSDWFVSVE